MTTLEQTIAKSKGRLSCVSSVLEQLEWLKNSMQNQEDSAFEVSDESDYDFLVYLEQKEKNDTIKKIFGYLEELAR
ncbi:MAG: hypothetical protein J6S67_13755 [Methanobrevibacter sp.]|nr:hypothetical protein [Methanobrevibacter sp.]